MSDELISSAGEPTATDAPATAAPVVDAENTVSEDQLFEAALTGDTAFLDNVYDNTVNPKSEAPAADPDDDGETQANHTDTPEPAPATVAGEDEDEDEVAPNEEILRKVELAKAAFKQPAPAPVQQTPVPQQQPAQESVAQDDEVLIAPKRPEGVPTDPSEWEAEDAQKMREYDDAKDEFNAKLLERQTRTEMTTRQHGEVVTSVQSAEAKRLQEIEHERRVEQHWNGIRALQRAVPSFNTSVDIEKLHESVGSFADQLHAMSGLQFNGDMATYTAQRDSLVAKYHNGDEEIISQAKASGIKPPADFESYMGISEVAASRQQLIQAGELGEKATLAKAYLYTAAENGDLDSAMEDAIVQERVKAGQSIAEATAQAKKHVRIPDQGISPAAPVANELGFPGAEAANLSAEETALVKEMQEFPQLINSPAHAAAFNKLKGVMFDA